MFSFLVAYNKKGRGGGGEGEEEEEEEEKMEEGWDDIRMINDLRKTLNQKFSSSSLEREEKKKIKKGKPSGKFRGLQLV